MEQHLGRIESLLVQARNSLEALRPGNNEAESEADPTPPSEHAVPSRVSANSGTVFSPSRGAINRHRALFQRPSQSRPPAQQHLSRSRSRSESRERQPAARQHQRPVQRRSFIRSVVCLADREATRVPSIEEKVGLKKCGLGEKTVSFPKDGSAAEVQDALFEAFPKLRGCGGFEMMRTSTGSRSVLHIICEGSCSSEELKSWCTNRLYIRPIQKDFDLTPAEIEQSACEKCLKCGMTLPINILRSHVEECSEVDEIGSSDENEQLVELPAVSLEPCDNESANNEVDAIDPINNVETGSVNESRDGDNNSDAHEQLIEQHSPARVGEVVSKMKRCFLCLLLPVSPIFSLVSLY